MYIHITHNKHVYDINSKTESLKLILCTKSPQLVLRDLFQVTFTVNYYYVNKTKVLHLTVGI